MRHAILAAFAFALAGCTQAQSPAAPSPEEGCAPHAASFGRLLGGDAEAARTALLAMPGIKTVRVVGPNQPVTMDYRHDRATMVARDGKVEKITCG